MGSSRGKADDLKRRLLDSVGKDTIFIDAVASIKEDTQVLDADNNSTMSFQDLKGNSRVEGLSTHGKGDTVASYKENAEDTDADDISTMSYRDLQQKCKAKGISSRGKADDLKRRLLDSVGKDIIFADAVASIKED